MTVRMIRLIRKHAQHAASIETPSPVKYWGLLILIMKNRQNKSEADIRPLRKYFRHKFPAIIFSMDFRQDMNEDIGGIVVTKTFNFLIFAFHGKLGNPGDAIHSVSELTIRLRDYLM